MSETNESNDKYPDTRVYLSEEEDNKKLYKCT